MSIDIARGEQLLERLRAYVKEQGGELAPGWRVEVKTRNSGTSAGTSDAYYFDPAGQRFRSRQEIMRHLEVAAGKSSRPSRAEAAANAQALANVVHMPLQLQNGVSINKLGTIDARPGYHSQHQLWPVGYHATWQDPAAGTFHCSIVDGGDAGPCFTVAICPDRGPLAPVQPLVQAHDLDSAWQDLASIQQAGLDAALAAKSKPRKPKQASIPRDTSDALPAVNGHTDEFPHEAAPAQVTDTAPQQVQAPASSELAVASASAARPTTITVSSSAIADGAAAQTSQTGIVQQYIALANGHAAHATAEAQADHSTASGQSQEFRENMAANSQQSQHVSHGKQQKAQQSDANAPHHQQRVDQAASDQAEQAKGASSEPEEPDAAVIAKQQLLMKAAPLAGMWVAERFGLADVQVLKLLEPLPGVEEHCTEYEYVEQRHGWDAEAKRLRQQIDKHGKQAAKANKGMEKKGAKLHQMQLQEQAKLDRAEERMEARAAAKRKRQEEKQAEKAELKRAKMEQAEGDKAQTQKPKPSPVKASPQAGLKHSTHKDRPFESAKPKKRSTSGMTKDEKDIQHVLNKVISQVERKLIREQEQAAQKAEKDAAKAQRHKERTQQKQAKQGAAEPSKQRSQAVTAQPIETTVDLNSGSAPVEDQMLPKSKLQPPKADPVGKGLLSAQELSGLIEVREFMARFVEDVPPLNDMEAAFVDPIRSDSCMEILTDVHLPLLELVVTEAFEAAIDVAGQENDDIRLHEMRYAMPPLKPDSWPELVRRYFALAATAVMVKASEASGGLDTALGALVGATPLALLGPFAVLQSLTAGGQTGEPAAVGAARLPLGASKTAPEALQVKQDAASLAAAEGLLLRQAPQPSFADAGTSQHVALSHRDTVIACRRMLLDIASIKGPKAEAGHADARSLSFDGQSAAAATRSGMPLDLMTIAARVDAGVYSSMQQGVSAFVADVEKVCYLYQAASKRSNSTFAAELGSQQAAAMADLVLDRMAVLMMQHSGAAGTVQPPTPGNKLKKKTGVEAPDSPEGEVQDDKQVNIVEDIERPFAPWEGCCICWEDEDRKHILLCDKCDAEYHTYCLHPPLEDVPEGEWFCPRCQEQTDQSDNSALGGLPSTSFTRQEDVFRRLAAALGQQEYHELTVRQRVQIAVLLCNFVMSSNTIRTQLEEAEDNRKEMRKELVHLRAKLKREEKERSAAAAADAAEAQSAADGTAKSKKDSSARTTRAAQEADAASELQKDLARIEQLTADIRKATVHTEMLGYDRHWNRYWLLQGSCPEAAAEDESPGSTWVYVEQCQPPPAAAHGTKQDVEEELPLGQLAQQAQHGAESTQQAKRRKVLIADDQGPVQAWGCYKTVEHVQQLTAYLNPKGKRESELLKALQRIRAKLPTAASLIRATDAANASAQDAQPKQATTLGEPAAAQQADTAVQPAAPLQASAATDASLPSQQPAQTSTAMPAASQPAGSSEPTSTSAPDLHSTIHVQANGHSAESAKLPLQPSSGGVGVDARPVSPEPAGASLQQPQQQGSELVQADSAMNSELLQQAHAASVPDEKGLHVQQASAPPSSLSLCREDIRAFHSSLAPEAFEVIKGSDARQSQWQLLLANATRPQELMAAVLLLESMLRHERFKPHWRICNMPMPHPETTGSLAAVRLRLQSLKGAVRLKMTAAPVVVREAKEASAQQHAGRGYAFRQRKAPGALAEPSAGESADEDSLSRQTSQVPAGSKRKRISKAEQAKVDEDEVLARQLQEQEEALARGGRATRASLRGPSKGTAKPPAPSARQAAVKQAAATRGAAGLRSSSRLKPSAAPAANVRTTRAAAAGMRTTRSQVHQEPTYSTENDCDSAESGGSASGDKSSSDDMPVPNAAVSSQDITSSSRSRSNQGDNSANGSGGSDANSCQESDDASAASPSPMPARPAKDQHGQEPVAKLQDRHPSPKTAADSKLISGRKRLRKAC